MLNQSGSIYEFGPFRLDSADKTLWQDGQPVPLTPKAFDTLLILVENNGHLVEKDELIRRLWPDSFVDENSLPQNIYLLRKALEKGSPAQHGQGQLGPGQRYIVTVPRRGYRFIAPVRKLCGGTGDLAIEQKNKIDSFVPSEIEPQTLIHSAVPKGGLTGNIYPIAFFSLLVIALFVGWSLRDAFRRSATTPIVPKIDAPHFNSSATQSRTDNAEAYQDYARGLFFWGKRTEEGMTRSITCFKQALEKDARYALAWAGLADAYAVSAYLGYQVLPEKEAYQQAQSAALRALELDNTLAEAHSALSVVKAYRDYDLRGAEAAARQAVALQTNNATAHQRHSIFLRDQGRLEEALTAVKRAQELDPLSPAIGSNLAYILYLRRDYESVVVQCRKVLETEPDYFQTLLVLGMTYERQNKNDEAIAVLGKAREQRRGRNGVYLNTLEALGHAYAAAGRRAEAEQILEELSTIPAPPGDMEYYSALIRSGLGVTEQVFALLETSSKSWQTTPVALTLDPRFEELRSDARYKSLFKTKRLTRFLPSSS
jgi:DNA-binding winged helix-turn-helix (wHTH) protein/Flp pilus assembly protein TadD